MSSVARVSTVRSMYLPLATVILLACVACGESDDDTVATSGTSVSTASDTAAPTQSIEAPATTEPRDPTEATAPATSFITTTLPTTTTPAAPASTAPDPSSNLTPSQRNAVRSAQSYLDLKGFSRQGLIDQLSSEYGDQYPVEDATIAVDSLGADWTTEAGRSAQSYLDLKGFSRQGLIDQLSSEYGDQFSVEEATPAVDGLVVDWNTEAAEAAQSYLDLRGFSCQGLIEQLSSAYGDQFTVDEATAGATQAGVC